MSVNLYMDVHVHRAITEGLRLHGVDVLTARADGTTRLSDAELLDRATDLERVLFSQDEDLLREAAQRQQARTPSASVIYAHQRRVTMSQCVRDMALIGTVGDPEDSANRVEYLRLR